MQSYYDEIREKRNAAKIFWLIVFIFAGFLYFFFQGYYPDISFHLTDIRKGSISGEGGVIIRSFGIVNVKVNPATSALILNGEFYGNDEKKMTNYGDYQLSIGHEGYLPNILHFTISKEKPFYIESISLVPRPTYTPFSGNVDFIRRIDTSAWMLSNKNGMFLYGDGLLTGTLISTGHLTPIGEGKFLSGSTIVSYDIENKLWAQERYSGWNTFLEKCPESFIKHSFLFCPKEQQLITKNGKIYSGVLTIQNEYIKTASGIIPVINNLPQSIIKTIANIDSTFIRIDDTWYESESGSLINLDDKRVIIPTLLESITHAEWLNKNLLVFGKKGKDTYLSLVDTNSPERTRILPFPDVPLEELKIWENNGNTFIKTKRVVLLIYRGSEEIHWIVDGEILVTGDDFVLYKKDGEIWKSYWMDE